jgi:DNA-binding Lrp family transcriptional regulator
MGRESRKRTDFWQAVRAFGSDPESRYASLTRQFHPDLSVFGCVSYCYDGADGAKDIGENVERSTVDETDNTIVRLLRDDGRLGHREIAQAIGLSRSAAAARINRLIDSGQVVVRGVVHPAVLGRGSLAHVALVVRGPAGPVARLVAERDDTPFVSLTAGPHAVAAEIRTSSALAIDRAVTELRSLPGVQGVDTLTYVQVERDVVGPVGEVGHEIDAVDEALLRALQDDGRASYVDLARSVRLTPAGVRRRVIRLIESQVVRVGVLVRQPGRAGRAGQAEIGVGLRLDGAADEVVERLLALPQASFVARTLGRFDALVTVSAYDPTDLVDGVETIRGIPGVNEVHSWTHLRVVKETYASAGVGSLTTPGRGGDPGPAADHG